MQKIIDGELHTRETVITRHAGLVRNIAKRMVGEYEVDDLVSEGNIGLVLAFDRFDPDKGLKFSTYAHHIVRGQMMRLMRRPASGPKWPHGIISIAWAIQREELHDMKLEVIADKLNEPVRHVERALSYLYHRNVYRLDGALAVEEVEGTLGDVVGSHDDESVLIVNDFLQTLTERDRVIVRELLLDKSQSEIGKIIGVSQNHVSRLRMGIQKKYEEYQRGAI